jgi:hypothetical protein
MACDTYFKNKKEGEYGERVFTSVLKRAGLPATRNMSSKKEELLKWDVATEINGVKLTAEVKFDIYEARTGNVAIEYYNTRSCKDSGINATEANLWVFVLADDSVWACNVKALRQHFNQSPGVRDVINGGDGNASFRLYRRLELFEKLFTRLDELPSDNIINELLRLS